MTGLVISEKLRRSTHKQLYMLPGIKVSKRLVII